MKLLLAVLIAASTALSFGQQIKVRSKGDDVQKVIDSVFEQAGYQYVLESNFKQQLYMNLDGIQFSKAIDIIGRVAELKFEQRQGIWFVSKRAKGSAHIPVVATPKVVVNKPPVTPKSTTISKGTVAQGFAPSTSQQPKLDMSKKVTLKMRRVEIKDVFEELGRQGKLKFDVDPSVPNFKLDVSFFEMPASSVLDKLCKAAKLKTFVQSDQTILISKL